MVDRDLPDGDPAELPEVEAPPATAADAPIRWLFYTSGTTADPKGAQHTDLTVMASALAMAECLDIGPTTCPPWSSPSPTSAASAG